MNINKIVLIEPKAPGDHVYKTINMPRLGLPLLGTILKKAGYAVNILLGDSDSLSPSDILSADLVGISTTTSTAPEAYRIARYTKSKGIPVVIGGIHSTFLPEDALPHADFVIRGEAESSFLELVKALEEEKNPAGITGVSYWENGEMQHNPGQTCWADVNSHPVPDLTLMDNYLELSIYPVVTSRGCPFDCSFCSVTPMFGKKFRYRDNELILDELAQYKDKKIFFVDDNFTANKKRTKELLQGMLDRQILPIHWGGQVRVDVARDPELLDLMQRTNGKIAYIGLESINPETMKSYNKSQDVEEIKEAVSCLHDHNVAVHGMFIFGGEGDTVQTIRETVDFALHSRIDTVQFMVLVPLPGTPLYENLSAEGRLLTRDWQFYDGHHVVHYPNKMSPQQLQQETTLAYKRFYASKHFLQNVLVTGGKTALYRALGWWLIRHWEKQNQNYQHLLEKFTQPEETSVPLLGQKAKSALVVSEKTPLLNKKNLQVNVSVKKDVIYLRVKGIVNKSNLKELYRQLNQMVPAYSHKLVVNTEGVKFASDKAARRFSLYLNNLGGRVRRLEVFCRVEDGLHNILEKYIPSLPRFEVLFTNH